MSARTGRGSGSARRPTVGVLALILCAAAATVAPSAAVAQADGPPAARAADRPPAAASSAPSAPPVSSTPPGASGAMSAPATGVDGPPARAGTARPTADDPALEARLVEVTRELRCLVCQNESIADSHAPLAVDMRNQIREQLRSGMSEREVVAFMVERYGNFVRFRPPLDASTLALWFGPPLLLVIGLGALALQVRRRSQRLTAPAPLQPDEAARLAALAADSSSDRSR